MGSQNPQNPPGYEEEAATSDPVSSPPGAAGGFEHESLAISGVPVPLTENVPNNPTPLCVSF